MFIPKLVKSVHAGGMFSVPLTALYPESFCNEFNFCSKLLLHLYMCPRINVHAVDMYSGKYETVGHTSSLCKKKVFADFLVHFLESCSIL